MALAALAALSVTGQDGAAQQRPEGGRRRPPAVTPEPDSLPADGWLVRPSAHASLWFHALAVIAADQPGPLGLYSAEYARHIRDLKLQLGVYPTALDSIAPTIREAIGSGRELESLHFVPLYFPRAEPERMLRALRAVAKRKNDGEDVRGRDVGYGVLVLRQTMEDRRARRILETLVDAIEREWNVFYREYWEESRARQDSLAQAMQVMWDTELAPGLEGYLVRRRLAGGMVMPSPALGPEGRIVEIQPFDPRDQVVAVQQPLLAAGPDATVFAFLKELCFLLVDDRALATDSLTTEARADLQRTAAVRCGALLLEFYVPQQVGRYRRAFLDAVGAEESATVAAFERVYYLDPAVYRRLHQQIRRP